VPRLVEEEEDEQRGDEAGGADGAEDPAVHMHATAMDAGLALSVVICIYISSIVWCAVAGKWNNTLRECMLSLHADN
jgi:hypothetical protein